MCPTFMRSRKATKEALRQRKLERKSTCDRQDHDMSYIMADLWCAHLPAFLRFDLHVRCISLAMASTDWAPC